LISSLVFIFGVLDYLVLNIVDRFREIGPCLLIFIAEYAKTKKYNGKHKVYVQCAIKGEYKHVSLNNLEDPTMQTLEIRSLSYNSEKKIINYRLIGYNLFLFLGTKKICEGSSINTNYYNGIDSHFYDFYYIGFEKLLNQTLSDQQLSNIINCTASDFFKVDMSQVSKSNKDQNNSISKHKRNAILSCIGMSLSKRGVSPKVCVNSRFKKLNEKFEIKLEENIFLWGNKELSKNTVITAAIHPLINDVKEKKKRDELLKEDLRNNPDLDPVEELKLLNAPKNKSFLDSKCIIFSYVEPGDQKTVEEKLELSDHENEKELESKEFINQNEVSPDNSVKLRTFKFDNTYIKKSALRNSKDFTKRILTQSLRFSNIKEYNLYNSKTNYKSTISRTINIDSQVKTILKKADHNYTGLLMALKSSGDYKLHRGAHSIFKWKSKAPTRSPMTPLLKYILNVRRDLNVDFNTFLNLTEVNEQEIELTNNQKLMLVYRDLTLLGFSTNLKIDGVKLNQLITQKYIYRNHYNQKNLHMKVGECFIF